MDSIYGEPFELTPNKSLRPDLFTAYKFSNGGKTVTFTIRPNVKFSDGTPFNGATDLSVGGVRAPSRG